MAFQRRFSYILCAVATCSLLLMIANASAYYEEPEKETPEKYSYKPSTTVYGKEEKPDFDYFKPSTTVYEEEEKPEFYRYKKPYYYGDKHRPKVVVVYKEKEKYYHRKPKTVVYYKPRPVAYYKPKPLFIYKPKPVVIYKPKPVVIYKRMSAYFHKNEEKPYTYHYSYDKKPDFSPPYEKPGY
ncbi:hypothetical protein KP509_25G008000 [Ceratopteris richardii]|uniref:Uncharacterized protein n=1 Tax=Ceratopteris richardii TaxID=49495 RepID=A0A8T2RPJ1_CERRI|nr:hypothetical protein KP509_25G008000 [Ceratopteris richardii]